MYMFQPVDSAGAPIITVQMTGMDLQIVRNTLVMALDYNPGMSEFGRAMEPVRAQLGDAFEPWLHELQKIKTDGERVGHINFTFEDWLTEWYIADFIDHRWTVAKIEHVDE
jgi:hypothetical protein